MINNIAWKGTSGVNVFWPLGGPVRSGDVYPLDPYSISGSGPWDTHVTAAKIDDCLAKGFDHFRLQPSPAPFMEAYNDQAKLDSYNAIQDNIVDSIIARGMRVMYSPFLSSPNIDPVSPLQGITTDTYLRYKEYVVNVATRYADRGDMFAIATMNEPPTASTFPADWPNVVQPDLIAAIRAAAPDMTIAVTSTNYSSHHTMAGSDWNGTQNTANGISVADNNILYEVHPFLPASFCLQGAAYSSYKHIPDLTWPPNPAEKTTKLNAMNTSVNADTGLTSTQKTDTINNLTAEMGYYFDTPQNQAWVNTQLQFLENWRIASNLPPGAIYIGEWGKTKFNANWPGGSRMNRIRYHRDMTAVFLRLGYRSSVVHLDTYDYGITRAEGEVIGDWDGPLLDAIAPGFVFPLDYKP